MRTQCIFRSLMILGALACVIIPLVFSNGTQDYSSLTLQPFACKSGEYTIGLPEGWRISESSLHGLGSLVTCKGPRGVSIAASCTATGDIKSDILRAVRSKESPIKPQHDEQLAAIKLTHASFDEDSTQTTSVSGQQALYTSFKYTSTGGFIARKMAGVILTTSNGNRPISFQLICPAKAYSAIEPLFEKCVATYTPKQGAG